MSSAAYPSPVSGAAATERRGGDMPIVGVTTAVGDDAYTLRSVYCQQVAAAGGLPVLIPSLLSSAALPSLVDHLDALLFTGGGDCAPHFWGEERSPLSGASNEERDRCEITLLRLARQRNLPVLGICRGMQMIAVAYGGKIYQDLSLVPFAEGVTPLKHKQDAARSTRTHYCRVSPDSLLSTLYDASSPLFVNSLHHQAVSPALPSCLRATAWATDGVVEAIEANDGRAVVGVQWHPEHLGEEGLPLFRWLVEEAVLYRQARTLHEEIVTVDSHCDTPMFFPQGCVFTQRDARLKVDVYKMIDGGVDVATMAAYVPQPVGDETWKYVMPLPSPTPFAYANTIFDEIERMVAASTVPLSLARTPSLAVENKHHGRRTIMLAVENALALDDNIDNIAHFKQRGVVYITLCHNGDNSVCDSAKRSRQTWGGLSPFGEKVVLAMQQQGVTVDLSHAAESTFYDVLSLATRPVVCSHSNCRALCDSPRNLSDDQLRALSLRDGLCHLTLYGGFLHATPSSADIETFVAHVLHAAQIMGVEHIGVGSDFDGDGGVRGLDDASDLLLFTIALLRRHFSAAQLRQIWGGNWLSLLAANQSFPSL